MVCSIDSCKPDKIQFIGSGFGLSVILKINVSLSNEEKSDTDKMEIKIPVTFIGNNKINKDIYCFESFSTNEEDFSHPATLTLLLEDQTKNKKSIDKMLSWNFHRRKESAKKLEEIFNEKSSLTQSIGQSIEQQTKIDFLKCLLDVYKSNILLSREDVLREWVIKCKNEHPDECETIFSNNNEGEDKAESVHEIAAMLNYMRHHEKKGTYEDTQVIRLLKEDFGNAFIDQQRGEKVSSRSPALAFQFIKNKIADATHSEISASKRPGKGKGGSESS